MYDLMPRIKYPFRMNYNVRCQCSLRRFRINLFRFIFCLCDALITLFDIVYLSSRRFRREVSRHDLFVYFLCPLTELTEDDLLHLQSNER